MTGLEYEPDFSWLNGPARGMTLTDAPTTAPPRPRIRVRLVNAINGRLDGHEVPVEQLTAITGDMRQMAAVMDDMRQVLQQFSQAGERADLEEGEAS